jgi:hypothetical protein
MCVYQKKNISQYLRAVFLNELISNFKVGFLGSSLTILMVQQIDNKYLTIFQFILVCFSIVAAKLGVYLTRNVKRIFKWAYLISYISDSVCVVLWLIMLTINVKLIYIAVPVMYSWVIFYKPLLCVNAYLNLKLFGGKHHLSVFKNVFDQRLLLWKQTSTLIGMLCNIVLFQLCPEEQAIFVTLFGFGVLCGIDALCNFIESIPVKKLMSS